MTVSTGDQGLRKALGYPRFRQTPRVLVLDTSYYTIKDIVDGARLLGWDVGVLPARAHGPGDEGFVAELLRAVVEGQPDYLLTVNHRGLDGDGVLAGLLDRYGIALASWFVDHPLPILGGSPGNVTAHTQLFCVERTALPFLAELGFAQPQHLPTATNPRYFHPDRVPQDRAAALGAPLCFVGQSWWGIARQDPAPWLRDAALALLAQRPLTRAYVSAGLCHELPTIELPLPADLETRAAVLRAKSRAAYVALAEVSLEARRALIEALRPLGPRIYGDVHWETLAPGLDVRPQPDPVADLPAIYAGSAVNVNLSAAGMPTALNLRVWDVPAAGGFLLTDAQEELLEHFRADEVATFDTAAEAAERARYYLQHPEERQAISRRARARIEAEHHYGQRLRRLDTVMRARFR